MKRTILLLLFCCASASGCATEREYFFNHNPFTDAVVAVGSFFEDVDPSAPID
jgi:hypothetical protein